MKVKWIAGVAAACLLTLPLAAAPQAPGQTKPPASDTKSKPMTEQNKTNLTDHELAQKVRNAIREDKSLVTAARYVRVTAMNGKVTLKGYVHSEDEKRNVEQKATGVAGAGNVTNDLTIRASRSKKTGSSS